MDKHQQQGHGNGCDGSLVTLYWLCERRDAPSAALGRRAEPLHSCRHVASNVLERNSLPNRHE